MLIVLCTMYCVMGKMSVQCVILYTSYSASRIALIWENYQCITHRISSYFRKNQLGHTDHEYQNYQNAEMHPNSRVLGRLFSCCGHAAETNNNIAKAYLAIYANFECKCLQSKGKKQSLMSNPVNRIHAQCFWPWYSWSACPSWFSLKIWANYMGNRLIVSLGSVQCDFFHFQYSYFLCFDNFMLFFSFRLLRLDRKLPIQLR